MPSALIVDDNPENLYLLEVLLKANGFTVRSAADGAAALEAALQSPPDLIISDILMPVMDGFAFCLRCRSQERFNRTAFIFYTATFMDGKDAEFGLSIGADRYLSKPQEPKALMRIIAEVLAERGARDAAAPPALAGQDAASMKRYGEIISRKLEQKALALERANAEVRELNAHLEERIAQRTAQLEASNRELEAFGHSVSHDLAAPLRAIAGFSQALREHCAAGLDDQGRQYLERILQGTERMGRLIGDLLKLSQISHFELHRQRVDLSRMARAILEEKRKAEPGRVVEAVIADGVVVEGDRALLQIALENLLSNAWKFTGGKARARIEFGEGLQDGKKAVCVRDDGAGFDPGDGRRLFGAFQRFHAAAEFPGTGIGLSIVQRIIHRHGGRIWAQARPGEGAAFYFTVPGADLA